MPDTTREGILTGSDRRYLADPEAFVENHTRQAAHARRERIRERIEGAVPDLVILGEQLSDEERAKLVTLLRLRYAHLSPADARRAPWPEGRVNLRMIPPDGVGLQPRFSG